MCTDDGWMDGWIMLCQLSLFIDLNMNPGTPCCYIHVHLNYAKKYS